MTNLTLGFSPCPNDTFIFDALVNHKIDTQGINFTVTIADVEELNSMAFKQQLSVTKISYHALGYLLPNYQLLTSGSALGNGCGPILIAKNNLNLNDIQNCKIAIPGKYTTANFLLNLAFPNIKHLVPYFFAEIEKAVLNNEVDAGLIIHENRFTYQQNGLIKILDLGEFWEQQTKLPIPLGGIAIKRNLPDKIKILVNNLLYSSVLTALQNPQQAMPYVCRYAQAMDEEVMLKHINLYVNDFTLNLGSQGINAVNTLYNLAYSKGVLPVFNGNILINKLV